MKSFMYTAYDLSWAKQSEVEKAIIQEEQQQIPAGYQRSRDRVLA